MWSYFSTWELVSHSSIRTARREGALQDNVSKIREIPIKGGSPVCRQDGDAPGGGGDVLLEHLLPEPEDALLVLLERLLPEREKGEEDEAPDDGRRPCHSRVRVDGGRDDEGARELSDAGEVPVDVVPVVPDAEGLDLLVVHPDHDAETVGEEDLNDGEAHEADVSAGRETALAALEVSCEVGTSLHEPVEGHG